MPPPPARSLELLDNRGKPFGAFQLLAHGDMLPMQQEAHEVGRGDRSISERRRFSV